MTRALFHGIFLGVAGAWLATLGACGRTAPGLDDYSSSDDDDTTSGRGGSATGGSSRGGSSTGKGGTGVGGSFVDTGGTAGNSTGAGGSSRGGSSVGGSSLGGGGGDLAVGGTFGKGGTVAAGGSVSDGGAVGVGGSAVGGAMAMGGSANAGAGGSTPNGGTGAMGGSSTQPGGISCGEEVCEPDASVCCSRRSQPSFCTYPGADCRGATLTCSGPGTCGAGEVCCYHALLSFCTSECEVSAGEPGTPPTIILCDSTADCGPDQTCVRAPRGIAYCGENL